MSLPIRLLLAVMLIALIVDAVRPAGVAYDAEEDEKEGKASSFPGNAATAVIQRKKRYLDFIPLTRMFVRLMANECLLAIKNYICSCVSSFASTSKTTSRR